MISVAEIIYVQIQVYIRKGGGLCEVAIGKLQVGKHTAWNIIAITNLYNRSIDRNFFPVYIWRVGSSLKYGILFIEPSSGGIIKSTSSSSEKLFASEIILNTIKRK